MVRRRPRPRPVLRCPKCFSYDINALPGVFTAPTYICRQCGYQGSLILEEDPPLETDQPDSTS